MFNLRVLGAIGIGRKPAQVSIVGTLCIMQETGKTMIKEPNIKSCRRLKYLEKGDNLKSQRHGSTKKNKYSA